MRTILTYLLLFLPFTTLVAATNDKSEVGKVVDVTEKTYNYEQFREAVNLQVEKQLKRLGRGKIIGFSKELMKKEEVLKLRSIEIEKRNEQLQVNSSDFKKNIKTFRSRQVKFLACLDDTDKQKEKRISHMVEVVSNMKPLNAAEVLSVQDADISIKILGLLSAEKVSKIFNLMKKEISARLQKQYMTMKK